MEIKIKKLNEKAVIPKAATQGDAGQDLVATSRTWDETTRTWSYGTGLSFEIPEGFVGLLFPRSSVYKYNLSLTNAVGVIDSGFRGEVCFKFNPIKRWGEDYHLYEIGDRIGQIIVIPFPKVNYVEAEELSESIRGTGGFGHTGK